MTIPSELSASREVQEQILADIQKHGFSRQSAFAVRLALEEAMINAIKHGNKLDPHKKVHIETRISPDEAEIIIEDEGTGFERHAVPDPTCDPNIEKCSGRGILLIESYMNRVEWSRGGRRLRMIRRNEDEALPRREA
jgi:serine/threonine-protein kinase RsbW